MDLHSNIVCSPVLRSSAVRAKEAAFADNLGFIGQTGAGIRTFLRFAEHAQDSSQRSAINDQLSTAAQGVAEFLGCLVARPAHHHIPGSLRF